MIDTEYEKELKRLYEITVEQKNVKLALQILKKIRKLTEPHVSH